MKKLLVVAVIFLSALSALIWVGVASAIPIVSVAELNTPQFAQGEVEIKDGQVQAIESFAPLRFTVASRSGAGPQILVESPRTVPENFKIGIDVGLRGSFDHKKRLFHAYQVTTKCPSKYEASKDGLKDAGSAPPAGYGPPARTEEVRAPASPEAGPRS